MKRILTLLALLLLVPALSFAQAVGTNAVDAADTTRGPALWPPGERYMSAIQSNVNGIGAGGLTVDGMRTEYLFEFTPAIYVPLAISSATHEWEWNTELVGSTTRSIFIPTTGFDKIVVSAFSMDATGGLEAPTSGASGGITILGTAFGEADRWTGGPGDVLADMFEPLTVFGFPKLNNPTIGAASAAVISTTDMYYIPIHGGLKGIHVKPNTLVGSSTTWVRVNLSKD